MDDVLLEQLENSEATTTGPKLMYTAQEKRYRANIAHICAFGIVYITNLGHGKIW